MPIITNENLDYVTTWLEEAPECVEKLTVVVGDPFAVLVFVNDEEGWALIDLDDE